MAGGFQSPGFQSPGFQSGGTSQAGFRSMLAFWMGGASTTPAPEVSETSRGGDGFRRKRRVEIREKERLDLTREERLERLRRELEEAYDELHGLKPAPEVLAEAKAIVAPFAEGRKTKGLPPPARIDFAAMAREVSAAKQLLALYEEHLNEEEAAAFMLLMH